MRHCSKLLTRVLLHISKYLSYITHRCRYEIEGRWTEGAAGGCFNFPTWRQNPQWEFTPARETNAYFVLMQPDPRTTGGHTGGGDEGGPKCATPPGTHTSAHPRRFIGRITRAGTITRSGCT